MQAADSSLEELKLMLQKTLCARQHCAAADVKNTKAAAWDATTWLLSCCCWWWRAEHHEGEAGKIAVSHACDDQGAAAPNEAGELRI